MTDNLLTEEIPEKFKDAETGALKTDMLLQSYKELEKKMSGHGAAPKSADEYCVNCDHGMFEADSEINQRLFEKGFTNDQAQTVYDLAAEKMVPMVQQVAGEFEADREVEKLIGHFGGTEKWKEVSRQLLAFGSKNLPTDVLDNLSSSFEGVMALYKMMKGEEPSLQRNTSAPQGASEKELSGMMRDPRYWRDKDPSFVAKVTDGFQNLYGK